MRKDNIRLEFHLNLLRILNILTYLSKNRLQPSLFKQQYVFFNHEFELYKRLFNYNINDIDNETLESLLHMQDVIARLDDLLKASSKKKWVLWISFSTKMFDESLEFHRRLILFHMSTINPKLIIK